jgi:phage terminase small subunit
MKKRKSGNGLILKEEKKKTIFVEEYLRDFNATRAYLASFGNHVTRNSARSLASNLLTNVDVMGKIDEKITERLLKLNITNEAILAEQAKIAFIDTRKFYEDGVFVGLDKLNVAQQACIESIETEEMFEGGRENRTWIGNKMKVKFYSRQKAIDNLMKYRKLINDTHVTNVQLNNNTVELTVASEELKEKLGVDTIIKLNKRLSRMSGN